jgi:hypothetical protein
MALIVERAAFVMRGFVLRTARSPLRPLWAALYELTARGVALIVAPRRSRTSVYLTGSLAFGEPIYGLSDIDLVAVSVNEGEARRVRRRYDALCRVLPPLRKLLPHFSTYDTQGLARVLAGSYLVNGLGEGRAVFLGPDAVADGRGLLLRPGLQDPREWPRLRGLLRAVPTPTVAGRLQTGWLELHHPWRYALRACGGRRGMERAALAVGLVAEVARIWLWLAHHERHDGKGAALRRALRLMPAEEDGLRYALEMHQAMHRSPPVSAQRLLACFVRISASVAELVDDSAARAGATRVELVGAEAGARPAEGVALLDWTALVLPRPSGRTGVVEKRLVVGYDDPTDPAALTAAAARGRVDRVPALRHGSLLVEPTFEVWGSGRLRLVQCRSSDPVSEALLDGRAHADFPELSGWSARDWARRAVAEHRAWLFAGESQDAGPQKWLGPRPASVSTAATTLGLLLSAARAALFLESVEQGSPTLALTLGDLPAALAARGVGLADAAEACAALDAGRGNQVPPKLVERIRAEVESLPVYASRRNAHDEEVSRACGR